MEIQNRRSAIVLYSGPTCPYSHRVRLLLAEKNISANIIDVDTRHMPEDLIELNPYNSVPTLVDRDLVLYESLIIMEYLDDRYPHPALFPVDPISRARVRLYLYRIERDWYSLLPGLNSHDEVRRQQAAKILRDGLTAIAPIFDHKAYFMSDEYNMADCSFAVLLWRLPLYGIELPVQAKALRKYMEKIFAREGFKKSLTDQERHFPERFNP